jgi:hypothetical protein
VGRWWIGINSSGDDLSIVNANDAGVPIGNVLVISRATGIITGNPVFGDTVTIGQLNVGNGGGQHLIANNGGVNFAKIFACQTGGLERWQWGSDTSTESGSNAGANFFLSRYNDAGTSIGNPLAIVRSSGAFIMADLQVSTSYANDAAAATGGVALGQLYRNGSVVQIRVT